MLRTIVAALMMSVVFLVPARASEQGLTASRIRLGMVNAQTGAAAGLGQGMRSGAMAVFDDINANGGIHGRQIELLVDDDAYEPDQAIDATLKMIEDKKVFALFGFVGTPTANAVLPIVKETNTPLIGVFSGAMVLRQPVVPEVFNIRASYDDELDVLVTRFIEDRGAKRFAVFYQDDSFGLAGLHGTERALKLHGLQVVAKAAFQRGTNAVNGGLATLIDTDPDVVIMVGPYAPLAAFIASAREQKLNASLATVSFVGTDNLVKLVGTTGNGVVISQVVPFPGDHSLPLVQQCETLLAKQLPRMNLGFVNFEGCITAKVLAMALEKAGPALTRTAMVEALESMHEKDLGGIRVSFTPKNHQASTAVFLTMITDGKIIAIKTIPKSTDLTAR
ncbi:branched-chain amino acid transport system substrate-binding protein [Luteibacter sp. W1I16]|uniref:ABC transporter substrate-binding protein n=1 Tax=Luteibacter sp. W1I16 TaxID=3373922 RepID=UPI003D23973A